MTTTPNTDTFTAARELQWAWKTPAMQAMAVAVCKLALTKGSAEFSALDLAAHGAKDHGGRGIAGSIFKRLADDGVLAPVGVFVGGEFVQKHARNAGGNPIKVWRLESASKAQTLLRVHGQPVPEFKQAELAV